METRARRGGESGVGLARFAPLSPLSSTGTVTPSTETRYSHHTKPACNSAIDATLALSSHLIASAR